MTLADGNEAHLHRREPEREGAGVVLDEHAEEALDRAEEGAMHHDRLMALAIFTYVLQLEARRQVEVELHRGELPEAAEDIDKLDVDLGAVEGGFAGDGLVWDVLTLRARVQVRRRRVPTFRRSHRRELGRWDPRSKARL